MSKFTNIFSMPNGEQVRIGKHTKLFANGQHADPVGSAIKHRNSLYRKGIVPPHLYVSPFLLKDINIAHQPKLKCSRCVIRTKINRKPANIDVYWSTCNQNMSQVQTKLKREYAKWCREHNKIAVLYNDRRKQQFFDAMERELSTRIPNLSDNLTFDVALWNQCVRELEGIKPIATTVPKAPVTVSSGDTELQDMIDLSHVFKFEVRDPIADLKEKEGYLDALLDPVFDVLNEYRGNNLKVAPTVTMSKNKLGVSILKLPVNRNVMKQVCAPFVIETKEQDNYLNFVIPSYFEGLSLNPDGVQVQLSTHADIVLAATLLGRSSYIYLGYLQKQRLLRKNPKESLEFPEFDIGNKQYYGAIKTMYETLLLQLGRKKYNSMTKCENRLQLWHDLDVCDVWDDQYGTCVSTGQWSSYMPKTGSPVLRRLQLLVLVARVEAELNDDYIRRQVAQRGIEGKASNNAKPTSTLISDKAINRFHSLKKQLYAQTAQHYPLTSQVSNPLTIKKPDEIVLARCVCCGSEPTRDFKKAEQSWRGSIQCPNAKKHGNKATSVSGTFEHESELHKLVIDWQRRNARHLDIHNVDVWNVDSWGTLKQVEAFVFEARRRLTDMMEFNQLTHSLPRGVVQERAGRGFMRNLEMTLLWAKFFAELCEKKYKDVY